MDGRPRLTSLGLLFPAAALIFLLAGPVPALAGEPADEPKQKSAQEPARPSGSTQAASAPEVQESPLVRAARTRNPDQRKSVVRIDNETVRNSTGKLSIFTGAVSIAELPPAPDGASVIAEHDKAIESWQQEIRTTDEAIRNLASEAQRLEQQLGSYEEDYYNEEDPAQRDALEGGHGNAHERLATIRQELAAAEQKQKDLRSNRPRID
jgi:hypothetical protein